MNHPPTYDAKLAAEQRARRAYDALRGFEFGRAVILPNRKAGFAQALVTKIKKPKRNDH